MHDFQRKKKIRKILYSPFVLFILAILLIVLISGVHGVYKKAKLSSENLNKEKIDFEKISTREKTLTSFIDYLKTDQGVENEIRTKFKAVKEGERVVVIINDKTESASTGDVSSATTTDNFLNTIFHWLW